MGNGRKAIIRDTSKLIVARLTHIAVGMPDESFEKWLTMVVRQRALRGSEGAKEMLNRADI